jgi:hypothetical protein
LLSQLGHALGAANIKLHGVVTKYRFIVIDGVIVKNDFVTGFDRLAT